MIVSLNSRGVTKGGMSKIVLPKQKISAAGVIILFFLSAGIYAEPKQVKPGIMYATELAVTEGRTDYLTYSVSVPEDAVAMEIKISHAPADLDIFVNHGSEVKSYESAQIFGISEQFNESLFFTRFSDPPLQPGVYFFDIVYQRHRLPVKNNEILEAIPFSFKVELYTETIEAELSPETPFRSTLVPGDGMFKTFTVNVPPEASDFRIDLYGSAADLDLLIKKGRYVRDYFDADYAVENLLTREHILISKESTKPLSGGIYYVTVLDQVAAEYPIDFTIQTRLTKEPPEELLQIPPMPLPSRALDRVLYATVEIISFSGKGSGCFVSPDGLIVTNWHVIKGYSGDVDADLIIAVTLDTRLPPVELFKAEVIDVLEEMDLALLQVSTGLYGQSIPKGYSFPYCLINMDHEYLIGDDIGCSGYPSIGGTGSRASVTFTRGILSGFEKTDYGTILKTDGLINSGSSGGAAVDKDFRLIGLPTIIMEESAGQLGFIHPVTLFPKHWLELIRDHGGR